MLLRRMRPLFDLLSELERATKLINGLRQFIDLFPEYFEHDKEFMRHWVETANVKVKGKSAAGSMVTCHTAQLRKIACCNYTSSEIL